VQAKNIKKKKKTDVLTLGNRKLLKGIKIITNNNYNTFPSSWIMDTNYSKLVNDGFKISMMQRFGEDISWLITRLNGKKMKKSSI